ncbi:hypothetical protein KP509_37G048100 [Ceratopteris richardii]|uniref:Uncharacterized protein n=1 Tax=Ceratopteris richardii TaxID=49495 RepID=A0A8T2Q7Q4_CERRI|nr:hypothetical protein KP509_37G048100 [Ceratopteris richardii]
MGSCFRRLSLCRSSEHWCGRTCRKDYSPGRGPGSWIGHVCVRHLMNRHLYLRRS